MRKLDRKRESRAHLATTATIKSARLPQSNLAAERGVAAGQQINGGYALWHSFPRHRRSGQRATNDFERHHVPLRHQ